MSKARQDAARLIAQHLHNAENASDQAYGTAAELAALLPRMRVQSRFAATVANNVYSSVARAIELQAQARQALVDAHHHCKAVADTFQITSYGELGDKGMADPETSQIPAVRRVA